jgi:60 kDa SS-A/Ro ribonucleoprotein
VDNALFKSSGRGKMPPKTDTVNEAGGKAYSLSNEAALAQLVVTGTFNNTVYASGEDQLGRVLDLGKTVDPRFVAKLAVYARTEGYMKDAPAVLMGVLAATNLHYFHLAFPLVIDNAKMLRNFVQVIRSGITGRKSLGTAVKREVAEWFQCRGLEDLFRQSVGDKPSLGDCIALSRPKPADMQRSAMYRYLLGKELNPEQGMYLPVPVKDYEHIKANAESVTCFPSGIPMEMLTGIPGLTKAGWKEIAKFASWTQTRMNLNTFARHGVFEDPHFTEQIAQRLEDREKVQKAKVFPYQLMTAFQASQGNVPARISDALQQAMEYATANVPTFPGQVFVFPDVSGSMSSATTGYRKGATSSTRCIDVAALVAATITRTTPRAVVIPFETDVVHPSVLQKAGFNGRDSVMTNAKRLASIGGGGTDCSAPLRLLNSDTGWKCDLAIFVSDNESWVNSNSYYGRGTVVMQEWEKVKSRNPKAKLVCIDLQPNTTTQAPERDDILNIGGFSDAVFKTIQRFASGETATLVDTIREVKLS